MPAAKRTALGTDAAGLAGGYMLAHLFERHRGGFLGSSQNLLGNYPLR